MPHHIDEFIDKIANGLQNKDENFLKSTTIKKVLISNHLNSNTLPLQQ